MKNVRGKCISCDRPLNIVRDTQLGKLFDSAFGAGPMDRSGPGWDTGSLRALGNGDLAAFEELRYAASIALAPVMQVQQTCPS